MFSKKRISSVYQLLYLPIHLSIMSRPVTNGAIFTFFLPLATVKIDSPSCANPMLLKIDKHGVYFATYLHRHVSLRKKYCVITFLPTPSHSYLGSNDLVIQLNCSKLYFKGILYDIRHQTSQYPCCIICHSHPRCTPFILIS